jgi:3-hydroxybutyrate dehydrogenase
LLNGFGDAAAIDALVREIAAQYQVKVAYNGADISPADPDRGHGRGSASPPSATSTSWSTTPAFSTPHRSTSFPWTVGTDHCHQSVVEFLLGPCRAAAHEERPAGAASSTSPRRTAWSPRRQKVAYVAAKHGVIGLTKVAALETANDGITCNAICPGWVLTPLVQKQIDALAARENVSNEQAKLKLLGEKQPSLEFVTPEQIGGIAVFLCSPAAEPDPRRLAERRRRLDGAIAQNDWIRPMDGPRSAPFPLRARPGACTPPVPARANRHLDQWHGAKPAAPPRRSAPRVGLKRAGPPPASP